MGIKRGIILAGGEGTRLRPATTIYNKHLALVYDKPMILYPIEMLKEMGCEEIVLVSGGNHIGGFTELLQDRTDIIYKTQLKAEGIAQALGCARGLVEGLFPVVLGDNYFSETPQMPDKPTLYTKEVGDPERFGVYQDGQIIEKPLKPKTNQAVIGLYVYDERVFDMIPNLKKSARGEFEITDINNQYLELGADVDCYGGYWSDMGTPNSLLEVANYVRS